MRWLSTLWGHLTLCVSLNSGTGNERNVSCSSVVLLSKQDQECVVSRWSDPVPACKNSCCFNFNIFMEMYWRLPCGMRVSSVSVEVNGCFCCSDICMHRHRYEGFRPLTVTQIVKWEPTRTLCGLFCHILQILYQNPSKVHKIITFRLGLKH